MNLSTIKSKIDGWGIKHSWLASKLNVSTGLVSQWWSGEVNITDHYEAKVSTLLSGLGHPPS